MAAVTLNYRKPDEVLPKKLIYICPQNFKELKDICGELRFASAVAMFGLILRQSKYLSGADISNVTTIASEALNPQDYLQNEFLGLVEKAKKLYSKRKKEKSHKIK